MALAPESPCWLPARGKPPAPCLVRRGMHHRRHLDTVASMPHDPSVDALSGTVQIVASRALIHLDLSIDGDRAESETTCTWAGAHVLTIHTVIPRRDLALELHSTFVGHPGIQTHVVHLTMGAAGREPSIVAAD